MIKTPQRDDEKLVQLLKFMEYMHPPGYTVAQLLKKLGIGRSTLYRRKELFEKAGFQFHKDSARRWIMHHMEGYKISLALSREEAAILSELLDTAMPEHPLSASLKSRMKQGGGTAEMVLHRFKSHLPAVIHHLFNAMRLNQKIEIGYFSASTGRTDVRIIEAVRFTDSLRYLLVYDYQTGMILNLKTDRILSAKMLDERCHKAIQPVYQVDAFHIAHNREDHQISIRMTTLAYRLLLEEYPNTESGFSESSDPMFPHRWQGVVYLLLPIGRFIMGLPGQVVVEQPEALLEHLRQQQKKFTW